MQIIQENNGLRRYLHSLIAGRDATPRSWLYESKSTSWILETWMSKLAKLQKGSYPEQQVFTFDTAQLSKWGPMGEVAPISQLDELLHAGFTQAEPPSATAFSSSEWRQAKEQTVAYLKSLGISELRPRTYERVIDDMRSRDTLESNSGWPDFQRRSLSSVKQRAITDAYDGAWRDYPAIALFRNYYGKTRLVWMFPMSVNIVEGAYAQVLLEALAKRTSLADPFFSPWLGFSKVKEVVTGAYDSNNYVYASDFAATDAHFTVSSTREVFDVLAEVFQAGARDGLRESLENLHTIPLVTGVDSIIKGYHGVASGSNWTNLIETVFDLIFSKYVSLVTDVSGLYAIGDDMTWVSRDYQSKFADILETLGIGVGQVIRSDKTTVEQNEVKSLQRLFIRDYRNQTSGYLRGVYSTVRALNSSVHPERFHSPKLWSSDMFCARQYMILENCVDHPLFEEFVKFVVTGQKDLVPFAKLKRSTLDAVRRKTKLLPGLTSSYNQERRDQSFADFVSIGIANSLQ